jgi:hypothetical protein
MSKTPEEQLPLFWEIHVQKFKGTKLTSADYCKNHNLNLRSFEKHIRLLAKPSQSHKEKSTKKPKFSKVVIEKSPSSRRSLESQYSSPSRIITRHGTVIEFDAARASAEWLGRIISIIEKEFI